MLTMDKIHDIRFRYYAKGEKIAEIAKTMQIDRRTVQKFLIKKYLTSWKKVSYLIL